MLMSLSIDQVTWLIENGKSSSDNSYSSAIKTLQMVLDLGMPYIGTAKVYGNGKGEELVGMAIGGQKREDVFLD
jgi:aryl-alcohol dehydrogenase-like predicted oxidoreductase